MNLSIINNRGKNEEVIEERLEAFDGFMKYLVQEKVGFEHLKSFLQTPNNLPYYGKVNSQLISKIILQR